MNLTPISYNGGTIWVDKEAKILVGDWYVAGITNGIDEPEIVVWNRKGGDEVGGDKVIGQSTNLSIPNIPYVEIEEDVEKLAWEWCDDHREVGAFKAGYRVASAKKYTEEDLENAFNLGLAWDGEDTETNTFNSFIQSLQPKIESIEVEMIWVNHRDEEHDEGGTLPGTIESYKIPVTYQKDGKTFLKVKKINYE